MSCSVPCFVNVYSCYLTSVVLQEYWRTTLMLIKTSLAEAEVNVLTHCTKFCEILLMLEAFFLFSWYWYKTSVLCTSIIEPSLAVVNVTCTIPSFVKLYYCCLKSVVLTILVQTLLSCVWWSLNMVVLMLMYHMHCTKFCEVLLSLDIFSSKYWYRTYFSARDRWTQSYRG